MVYRHHWYHQKFAISGFVSNISSSQHETRSNFSFCLCVALQTWKDFIFFLAHISSSYHPPFLRCLCFSARISFNTAISACERSSLWTLALDLFTRLSDAARWKQCCTKGVGCGSNKAFRGWGWGVRWKDWRACFDINYSNLTGPHPKS